jgi:REP element-mobilizing transposase RayT
MSSRGPTLAYHIIFGTYGFWLPNDPRGSWSIYVGSRELHRFGDATKIESRRSVAGSKHDHAIRQAAKRSLRYPPVLLTGRQAQAVALGFAQAIRESHYRTYACAVVPNHVHLVLAAHDRPVRRIIGHLKARATRRLKEAALWPDAARPVWAKYGWCVFLSSRSDVVRTIRYVERNPVREKKPPQRWSFVVPFADGKSQT